MQSYFLAAAKGREKSLRGAQIPFEPFQVGTQKGLVFDGIHLPGVLGALHSVVEHDEKSPYDGIRILHLKRVRNDVATPVVPVTAEITAQWSRHAGEEQRRALTDIVREFNTCFGVREISIFDNGEGGSPQKHPCLQEGKLCINFWCTPHNGELIRNQSVTKLWGHEISSHFGLWNIWPPSGEGIIIKDDAGTDVAEVVGNNIYVLYPITDSRVITAPQILRKILEEALVLRDPAKLAEQQRQYAEKLLAEVRANPVVVKCWRTSESLREKFSAVAKDFVQAFGEKQILIYDYYGKEEKSDPVTDGRVHIRIWSSAEELSADGYTQPTLFGAPLKWDDRKKIIKPSGNGGVLLTDDEGNQVGKVMGDTIYIHYPLTDSYANLKWDGKGPEALFRRILEEVVYQKTATEKQKAARARAIAEKYRARSREMYVVACNGRSDRMLIQSRKIIDKNPGKVREYQQAIVKLIHESQDAERALRQIEGSRAEAATAYAQEFDRLFEVPKIRNVQVNDSVVKVFTDTLYCVDPRTEKRHEIGAFLIEMNLDGTIHWFNLSRKVDGYERGMHAPHIFANGTACLGNMAEVIPELVANYEFAALAMVCIQFVESVNVDDAGGKYINKWPVAV
ncbi:MAG: hypothetical protein Q8L52_03040 [bacterium]|nr:hypothetical protein [bacterium]